MKTKWLALLMVFFIPFPGTAEDLEVNFFSHKNFYIYAMGGQFFNIQRGIDPISSDYVAPIYGAGYTLVNIKEKFLINLEFDYSPGRNDTGTGLYKKTSFSSIMTNLEYRLRKDRISVFSGVGLAIVRYGMDFDDYLITLATSIGMKIRVSSKLLVRLEYKNYLEEGAIDEYSYFLDELFDSGYYYYEPGSLASVLALGLELHF